MPSSASERVVRRLVNSGCVMNTTETRTLAAAIIESEYGEQEKEIRKYLWISHGHVGLYGDDGEMQCSQAPACDFKRAPIERCIEHHMKALQQKFAEHGELVRLGKALAWAVNQAAQTEVGDISGTAASFIQIIGHAQALITELQRIEGK